MAILLRYITPWDNIPIPPTFYRAAPSSIMKPHSNESFDGKFQLEIGVKYRGENPRESYLCPHPEIRRFSGISPQKIPEIVIVPVPKVSPKLLESLSPSPSPNFGVFWGFSPENPRCADCPHPRPRNIGEIVKISGIPRKSPKELE